MTTKEILIKAKSFIERGWVQYVALHELLKVNTLYASKMLNACKWCATGALMAAENKVSPKPRLPPFAKRHLLHRCYPFQR